VKATVISSDAAKLGGDGVVEHLPDDLFKQSANDMARCARPAKFVHFLDVGRDGRNVGRSQILQFHGPRRYLSRNETFCRQISRSRNESRPNNGEDQSRGWSS
jgi:hypothetical protein